MHIKDGPWVGETTPMGIENKKRRGGGGGFFKTEMSYPMPSCVGLCRKRAWEASRKHTAVLCWKGELWLPLK